MQEYFPFTRLGLRRNPFGSLTDAEWQAITVFPAAFNALLQQDITTIQFLGARGRGKSTLLRALRQHYLAQGENLPYEYLPEGKRGFETDFNGVEGFVLDEAQRLSWWERRRLFRQIGGKRLFLSTHEDFRVHCAYWGRTVVTVDVPTYSNCTHLAAILARRVAYFALPNVPHVIFDTAAVETLWQRFGDDFRTCEHYLYEVFQRLPAGLVITSEDLG